MLTRRCCSESWRRSPGFRCQSSVSAASRMPSSGCQPVSSTPSSWIWDCRIVPDSRHSVASSMLPATRRSSSSLRATMMGWRLAAVHAGAQDYLVKSATDAALLARSLRYACERARLRRSLTEREARFRALVDQSQEAITLLDEHRVALYNSRAVETVTGYSPEELKGQSFDRIVHDDDVSAFIAAFQHCLDHPGLPTPVEYRIQASIGEPGVSAKRSSSVIFRTLPSAPSSRITATSRTQGSPGRTPHERGTPAAGPQDGGRGTARGRHRARFQQRADGDLRIHGPAARAAGARRPVPRATCRRSVDPRSERHR